MIELQKPNVPFDIDIWDTLINKIKVDPSHTYLSDKFDRFLFWKFLTDDRSRLSYSHPQNFVGYQQRCWQVFWSIYACHQGGIGLDLGSAGLRHPWLLSTDCPSKIYQDKYDRGSGIRYDLRVDAFKELPFGDNVFSLVISNHVIEHCPYRDAAFVIQEWLRVVKPGGYLAVITPHNDYVPVLKIDPDHKSAWTPKLWQENVMSAIDDKIDLVEFDTFKNDFSFNFCGRKR